MDLKTVLNVQRRGRGRAGVFSPCCLALDSSSSFPCPAFWAIAKSDSSSSSSVAPRVASVALRPSLVMGAAVSGAHEQTMDPP
ncbi:hypothetical protein STEG23_002097 [Scotinomys teguina]